MIVEQAVKGRVKALRNVTIMLCQMQQDLLTSVLVERLLSMGVMRYVTLSQRLSYICLLVLESDQSDLAFSQMQKQVWVAKPGSGS